jgi:hypothetical protein
MAGKAPNPFGAARKQTPAATAAKGTTYLATAVVNPQGQEIFSIDQTRSALDTFLRGARLASEAKNLQDTSRPVIDAMSLMLFTREWHSTRKLPKNPRVSATAGGSTVTYIVQDRAINVTDDEKARIAAVVGAGRMDGAVVNKEVFTLDPDVLEQTVTVKNKDAKGKVTEKTDTVMNHMAEALQQKFVDHPDLLAALFTVKPVQQTAKGLITRGLELAGDSPARLQEFLDVIKAPTQIKPVGV